MTQPTDTQLNDEPIYKIGDKVSVRPRFGETGTITEIKDGRYGINFHNLDMTLWYDQNEIAPQSGEGFSWYRPKS